MSVKLTGVYWRNRPIATGGEWVGVFIAGSIVRHLPLTPRACTERAAAEREAKSIVRKVNRSERTASPS